MNRIDQYLKVLGQAFEKTGEIAPWPIHVGAVAPYFSDVEARDIYDKLKMISKQDQPKKILRKLVVAPAVTKALLMDLIVGLKAARPPISARERVWFVEYIFDVLEEMMTGDIFCRDGTNLLLTKNEAQKLSNQISWIWLNSEKELGRSIYKASASTKSLIWSLYFYGWDDIGYEIHGPYKVQLANNKKALLVITDYFDIKPTLLWPSMITFPHHSIRLMALYDPKTDLKIDIFCHMVNKGDLLNNTVGLYLEANDLPIRTKEGAEALSKELLERVMKQHKALETMKKEEIIKKYIESRYYAFRRWRIYFGEDWYPPKKVLERIKKWGIIELKETGGPTWEELKKAFDPRTEVIPGKD